MSWLRRLFGRPEEEAPEPNADAADEVMALIASDPIGAVQRQPAYLDGDEAPAHTPEEQSQFLEIRDKDLDRMAENAEEELGGERFSGLGRGVLGPLLSGMRRPWDALPGPIRFVGGALALMLFVFGLILPILVGPVRDMADVIRW